MTVGFSVRSLPAFASPEAGFDYFTTDAHHRSLAGRILGALGGFSVVVVTGDPPASAHHLSAALSEAAASRHRVIGFAGGPEPGHDLPRFRRALSASLESSGAAGEGAGSQAPASPLVMFDDADWLSDEQIEEIFSNLCPRTQFGGRRIAAAVLLARPQFPARLERPALRFWLAKRLLVARLHFQELGADEIPAFIRHQLGCGGGEDAFTNEAVIAIASVAGGDPVVVNRFSRRLLDFAAGTSGDRLAQAAVAPAALVPTETPFEERRVAILDAPARQRTATPEFGAQPSTRMRLGGGAALKLSAGTVFCLACIGAAAALLMHPAEEKIAAYSIPVNEVAATVPEGGSSTGEAVPSGAGVVASAAPTPGSPPEEPAGSSAEPAPTAGPAASGGTQQEAARPIATPAPVASPAGTVPSAAVVPSTGIAEAASTVPTPLPIGPTAPLRLSAAEIAALLARGDRMLALGDIASARLFYERASEAGDGGAALKLARTFDSVVLHFARLYGVRGDADKAAYWYRRARELAEVEAR